MKTHRLQEFSKNGDTVTVICGAELPHALEAICEGWVAPDLKAPTCLNCQRIIKARGKMRIVQPAPRKGTIPLSKVKKAVAEVKQAREKGDARASHHA